MDPTEKKFPSYFSNFELPKEAKCQHIRVYRACKTETVDKESFLPTYEENGYNHGAHDPSDPSVYALSTYEEPKDVKRFADLTKHYDPPYKIAIGKTEPDCGPSQRTRERKPKRKCNSHVDWWLYENANPHEHFNIIDDFINYFENYEKERSETK